LSAAAPSRPHQRRGAAQLAEKLEDSLVLVHGGMAQDVGPILEMVTEKYLLRGEAEWQGRQQAIAIFDEILACLKPAILPLWGRPPSAISSDPSRPSSLGPAISTRKP
jgi:hypothetical protein